MRFEIYDTKYVKLAYAHSYGRKETSMQLLWKQFSEQRSIENTRTQSHQGKAVQVLGKFTVNSHKYKLISKSN